jgi:predicted CXXCH cytochrome family protein
MVKGKTVILLSIFLLLLAIAVVAYGATVVGSKHDISTAGEEVCIYCHTPHFANAAGTAAPLWNRNITNINAFTMYTSTTMNTSVPSHPSPVSISCLTCHDDAGASSAVNSTDTHDLRNGPGSGSVPDTTSNPNCARCHPTMYGYPDNSYIRIGPNLGDDHPISMTYPTTAQDPAFNIPPDLQNGWSDVKLFSGKVECASCHDPHDNTRGAFLRKSNSGSSLCFTCHIK